MATPEQQRRIDAEARLLQAVVNDDVEGPGGLAKSRLCT